MDESDLEKIDALVLQGCIRAAACRREVRRSTAGCVLIALVLVAVAVSGIAGWFTLSLGGASLMIAGCFCLANRRTLREWDRLIDYALSAREEILSARRKDRGF